ncbi:hypothetical protein SO802_006915 [Lithocarpus litseifolius]|uniref:RNase H type-1 domain-containing protein n=1 Tax=Lithocarpus litseifolius TaxID=425828 RepID=A0AAW2DPT0_9ROSI
MLKRLFLFVEHCNVTTHVSGLSFGHPKRRPILNTGLEINIKPSAQDEKNTVRHGGASKQGKTIAEEARRYREEVRTTVLPKCQLPKPLGNHKHWSPPPQDWYKVNVDAAVFKENGTCGIGVVIRNNMGQIMGAMSKQMGFPLRALEAEAKAAEAGILLAWDLGLKDIIVEGDAQMVIQAINGGVAPAIPILKIIEGSRRCLQMFCSWKAVHTNRKNNTAAHLLAKDARNVKECVIWVEETPPCIENQIKCDVSELDVSPY